MDIWGTNLGKTLPDEVYKPPPPQPGNIVNGMRVPHPYEKGTYVMKAAGPLMGLQDPKSWGRAGGQNISQTEGKDKKQKGQKQKNRENRRFTQHAQKEKEKEKEWASGNVQKGKEQQGYPRGKAWLVAAETAINTALNSQIVKDDPAIAAVIERRWKENPDAFIAAYVKMKPTGGNKSGGWKDGWESE
uniref:Uncharacterized protein n=1 Tax=Chromera velia CCMP2878 TaxID=1169474 RepID=A0A0G4I4A6_9ALVE|eukprot:Cvel_10878.t1-p1 / transcript=Cvel_10878.t1 / gene=Cvel_10878 / organism=Chromera_velia_CCMP2878 / gene_product=hypothetical protein / transcript_product=hypothetical protein / location=Cvel_scaffold666:70868-71428(+) / protein_length=187 / sequence_SO=supercontig / SO=protein_coding / is_pseudo=false